MSQKFIGFATLFSLFSGLICWYFAVLSVTHPVIHPMFDPNLNTYIDVMFDIIMSDFCFVIFIHFENLIEDDDE